MTPKSGKGMSSHRRSHVGSAIEIVQLFQFYQSISLIFSYQSSTVVAPKDIRMILIEAESRVLYDTATVIPVRNGLHPATRGMSACGEFQFLRRKKDTVKLSQMIFGGVSSAKVSDSFRIHVLELVFD